MASKELTAAEVKFLEFDWAGSTDWQHYFSNLYPTPPLSKVPKFKRTWFRRNVDSTLDKDSVVGDLEPTATHASATPSPPTGSSGSAFYNKFASKFGNIPEPQPPMSLKSITRLVVLRMELYMRIVYVVVSVVLALENLVPSISFDPLLLGRLYRLSYAVYLTISILRQCGFPKLEMSYARTVMCNADFCYMIYSIAFVSVPRKAIFIIPQVITTVVGLCDLYKSQPQILPAILRNLGYVKRLQDFVDKNVDQFFKCRASLECTIIPYLLISILMDRKYLLPFILYVNFVRLKIAIKDWFLLNAFREANDAILRLLSNSVVPPQVKGFYLKATAMICKYFTAVR